MDVTIFIVTHNSEKVIEACLQSLPKDQRIIVLDNASSDRTREIVANFPQVEIVKNANIGYGKAANIGFRMTKTAYALLLNPDVILAPGSVEAMVEKTRAFHVLGAVSAKTYHKENGKKIYQRDYQFDANGLFYTDWLVGALMLFNMQAIERAGMFDENFFLFFEETDLCTRIADKGYKLAIVADAEGEHLAGTSTPSSIHTAKIRSWHNAWSRAYFYKKHYGMGKALRKSLVKLVKNLAKLPASLKAKNERETAIYWYEVMGMCAFFLKIKAYRKSGAARIV